MLPKSIFEFKVHPMCIATALCLAPLGMGRGGRGWKTKAEAGLQACVQGEEKCAGAAFMFAADG